MGCTDFPEPKDRYSAHDREWIRRIEDSLVEFKGLDLTTFSGAVTCRTIDDSPSREAGGSQRTLRVQGNTVFRIHERTVSMMLDGELQNVGAINHNGRIIRSSRSIDPKMFEPINYPGKPHTLVQYSIFRTPSDKQQDAKDMQDNA